MAAYVATSATIVLLMLAELVAGPPRPEPARATPAEQAIAAQARYTGRAPAPSTCPRARAGEILVCGEGDRLPLREERGAPDGPRIASGEPPRAKVGGSPVVQMPATGVHIGLRGGKVQAGLLGER